MILTYHPPDEITSRVRLIQHGQQILYVERDHRHLHGHVYSHNGESRTVVVDRSVLGYPGCQVYAEQDLLSPLASVCGIKAEPLSAALRLIEAAYGDERLVVGVSGYTFPGYSYPSEARALKLFFEALRRWNVAPVLVTDGCSSSGVLGLSSVYAKLHGIPTLGFASRQGLPEVGSVVLIIGLRDYDDDSVIALAPQSEIMQRAAVQGRVFYAPDATVLEQTVVDAYVAASRYGVPRRPERFELLTELLAA